MISFLPAIYALLTDLKPHLIAIFLPLLGLVVWLPCIGLYFLHKYCIKSQCLFGI